MAEYMKTFRAKSLGAAGYAFGGPERGTTCIWLLVVTFLALVLRIIRLGFRPLWWDEGWTVYFATADVPAMIARTAIDIHPPFYYLVLHLWTLIAGSSVISVRLFSALVGALSIPVIFMLGRRLFDLRVGIMAALVMALAPFQIYYSQEARMYALATLLVLASVYLFLTLLQREVQGSASGIHWVLYVLVTSLAMYTQYYAAFVPVAQTVFLLVAYWRYRALVVKWLAAQMVLLLVYLPWVVYAGGKLVAYVSTKLVKEGDVPVSFFTYFQQHLLAVSVGHVSQDRAYLLWMALVFAAVIVLGMVGYLRKGLRPDSANGHPGQGVAFLLMYLLIPLSLGYLVNVRYPFTSPGIERLFLFSAPAFYLLMALGLSWIWHRLRAVWPACLLLVAVCIPLLADLYTHQRYAGADYRPLIETVQALAMPDDVIVAIHPWQIGYFHAYYDDGQLPDLYLTPKDPTDVTSEKWASDPALMARDLDGLLDGHRFLWFPAHQALGRILESDVEGYLSQKGYPILGRWFTESTRLSCYAGGQQLELSEQQVNFGRRISLLGYRLTPGPVEAAWGAVLMDLRWRIDGELDGRYQIALRLTDTNGQVWASEDREPVGGFRPFHQEPVGGEILDRDGLLVPAGTPPGSYQLRLGVYRLEDGRWLDVLDHNGKPQGVEAVLGTIEVQAPATVPPIAALSVEYPRQAVFEPGIRLLGYSLGGESFRPGDTLEIILFWQSVTDLSEDYYVSLQLQDGGGQELATSDGPLSKADYPTSQWRTGQLVRGSQSLLLPSTLTEGEYSLILTLLRVADGQPVPLRRYGLNWGDNQRLGTIQVLGRSHQMDPPSGIGHPMSLRVGDVVRFLGYDLDALEVGAGGSLRLTLYWQAISQMDTSYTVFNHLIDDEGRIWGQKDGIPGNGSLPTSSWLAGEYVIDEYEIPVQEDTPPGAYLIETGMYNLATMGRLRVFDKEGRETGDRILLEDTPVRVGP
jgi:4-amino-4-deoxy-L-arabinose transferase-like glycosyltransferase